MKKIHIFSWLAVAAVSLGLSSCEDELSGPQIDTSAITSGTAKPALTASNTAASFVFLEEDQDDKFQDFTWAEPDFKGVSLPLEYTLQLDLTPTGTFAEPINLYVTAGTTKSFTVKEINRVLYDQGLALATSHPIHFRVKAVVKGISGDADLPAMYSNVIKTAATIYSIVPLPNYASIGIIGSATPGGWDSDTDMEHPSELEVFDWKVVIYLTGGGEVKFRANNSWDTNWGGTGFPNGVGEANGPNIPIANSGAYEVRFNDVTGAYSFVPAASIGIIGDATRNGWDSDYDMETTDYVSWSLTTYLKNGEMKFRRDNAWATNWGGSGLSGTGVLDGGNIAIATAGYYTITFNLETAAYTITKLDDKPLYDAIGVVGAFTDWGGKPDVAMTKDGFNPHMWSVTTVLPATELKFRANSDWGTNWGGDTFPSGTAATNGANWNVTEPGTYAISFNSYTNKYSFVKQ